jgi:hypothetical protein
MRERLVAETAVSYKVALQKMTRASLAWLDELTQPCIERCSRVRAAMAHHPTMGGESVIIGRWGRPHPSFLPPVGVPDR